MGRLDDVVLDVLDGLRACLVEQLEPAVCVSLIEPGSLAVADYCTCGQAARGGGDGCGMAWTRLDRVYPYRTFPQIDQAGGVCHGPKAAVIELGVFRCRPVGSRTGTPTPESVVNAALAQVADLGAMQRAVDCCPALVDRNVVLGTYTPRDSGDCGGGVWPVTVSLNPVPPR